MSTIKIGRKRGRPPAFDRNDAIETALELFWKKGYNGVGVAELGDAIGINPPSLYKAFGSKHGLFEAAVQRYAASDKGDFLTSALAGAGTLQEAVYQVLVQAAKSYTCPEKQPGCLVLSSTSDSSDSMALATTDAQRRATKEYLAETFQSYGAVEADKLADYVLIAMTGLSCAARQGIDKNIIINTAECFADVRILSQESKP